MTKSFTATIDAWVAETQERIEAVAKASALDVISEMQLPVAAGGNMPVLTGFLRNSLKVTVGAPSSSLIYADGTAGSAEDFEAKVAAWNINETLYALFLANYAIYVNYGANGRPGRQFVGLAAQNWQSIVSRNAAKLKNSTFSAAA